jgi:hypothetical protein
LFWQRYIHWRLLGTWEPLIYPGKTTRQLHPGKLNGRLLEGAPRNARSSGHASETLVIIFETMELKASL